MKQLLIILFTFSYFFVITYFCYFIKKLKWLFTIATLILTFLYVYLLFLLNNGTLTLLLKITILISITSALLSVNKFKKCVKLNKKSFKN